MQKIALVGGASEGIGYACAVALAAQGVRVIGYARNAEKLAAAFQNLPQAQLQHQICSCDASIPAQVAELIVFARSTGPVQMLINNSGGPAPGKISAATAEQFQAAFQQQLLTAHQLANAFLPDMFAVGFGRIVNIISTSVKEPLAGLGVSNTIRAAVAAWAKTLAAEVAERGVTVNNVLPGYTRTARLDAIIRNRMSATGAPQSEIEHAMLHEVPAKRFAEAAEVAAAAAFLCSEPAAYINGVNIPVDGGRTKSL